VFGGLQLKINRNVATVKPEEKRLIASLCCFWKTSPQNWAAKAADAVWWGAAAWLAFT
jgi:hypothetical protein